MSIPSVRAAISKALTNERSCASPRITTREATTILKEVNKNGVTEGEFQLVADLFVSGRGTAPAAARSAAGGGMMMTMACPESTSPTFDANAEKKFRDFLGEAP